MLVIIGDTHGTDSHRLEGRTLDAVREADHVCHTGDFTTEAVYEAIAAEAGSDTDLTAVQGNNDSPALRERLPETATFEAEGYRFVVAHGHRHDATSLDLLAREADADVVVVGHSHRPGVEELPSALVVNPGSYADPRRYDPAYGEIQQGGGKLRLRTPAGSLVGEWSIQAR